MSRAKRKPLEFFKFFWRDFYRDTAHLTRAQSGGYLQVLCAYYDNQGPLHENVVLKSCGATDEEWKAERPLLAEFFTIDEKMMWHHKRIESELKQVRKHTEASRRGGKKSAESRKNKGKIEGALQPPLQVNPKATSTTKDVKGNSPTVLPLLPQRLSKREEDLQDAREAVWKLEKEVQQLNSEMDSEASS